MAIARGFATIKVAAIAALLTLVAGVLSGCGAGSPPNSQFQGSYRSQYTIPAESESGTFTFSVAQKGGMTGSFVDQQNASFPFSGSVSNNGDFNGVVTYSGVNYSITGTLTASTTSGGVAGGDFHETRNGTDVAGNFIMETTSGTVTSNFEGSYSGETAGSLDNTTVSITPTSGASLSLSTADSVSITINAEGAVIGTVAGNQVNLTVTNDGNFTGTIGSYVIKGALAAAQVPEPSVATPPVLTATAGIAANFVIYNTSGTEVGIGFFNAGGGKTSG